MRPGLGVAFSSFVHPGVVVGAVVDDDSGGRELAQHRGRGLEQMRVLVGIAHDADHLDLQAADLVGDVAVEILRRHQLDHAIGGAGGGRCGNSDEEAES